MESLHAPWRIAYILGPKSPPDSESVFFRIWQGSDDVTNLVIARGKSCYALLNRYPYTGGHLMVVPYRQCPDLDGLTEEELTELMLLVRRCKQALTKAMSPNGFNIGINIGRVAGAGIEEHLHIHVVPRWNGDTNFMPVTGCTSVLPEALEEVAAKLRLILTP